VPQTIDQQLAGIRVRADVLASRLVRKMQADIHASGKEDREILGIRTPTLGDTFAQIGRNFAAAFRPTGDSNAFIGAGRQMGKATALDRALEAERATRQAFQAESVVVASRKNRSIRGVIDAWTVPGSHPMFHHREQERLRRRWPVLAAALDELEAQHARPTSQH
jgi:hypothetical protein